MTETYLCDDFFELTENEMHVIDGGGFWDVIVDATVGAVAGVVSGFVKGFVVGVTVGVAAGPGGVIAGAISCGVYYAGKGAVIGALTNVASQQALEVCKSLL